MGDILPFLKHLTKYVAIPLVPPCLIPKTQNITTYFVGASLDTFPLY